MGHLGTYAYDATGVWSSLIHDLGAVAAVATTPRQTLRPASPVGKRSSTDLTQSQSAFQPCHRVTGLARVT
jgi:hypothetical protein